MTRNLINGFNYDLRILILIQKKSGTKTNKEDNWFTYT